MASTNQGKAKFISVKLNFMKDQGERLISAVGVYVNRIIAVGDSWTKGVNNNLEYQELSQMIDTAIEFLCEKCDELTGGSVGVAAIQLSFEKPGQTSQSITATASTPAASYRQPVVPLASTATTSYRQPAAPQTSTVTTSYRQPAAPQASTATTSYRPSTESVQPADENRMKPVLDRIAVIEEAMCSLRSRTETVAENQSVIDHQLKEVLSKLSESDQKHSSRFKQVKQQICDISDTQEAIKQEQKTRLQTLEKELQKISTAQERQKGEMESQAELVEKLVHVPNLLESVKEIVDALDARIDRISDECRNKYKHFGTEMRDLADNVMDITHSVQLISEGHVQKAKELKANFRILCQMLNDRLRPLEQLRTCFNERASMRDDNVTKLSQLIQEVAVMSPRLQQLEVKSSATRCGFTARTRVTEVAVNTTIRQYEKTSCNVGENFNADSGIFTAPVDGLYVVSISLLLSKKDTFGVGVQNLNQCSLVCWSSAETKNTTACGVGVVDMKAGDMLYSFVYQIGNNNDQKRVFFSCFLLG